MNNSATVHARIDAKTKCASERVLHKIGMTPTDAVRRTRATVARKLRLLTLWTRWLRAGTDEALANSTVQKGC
ncbi:MAG: type II toxin-antitoxin system RelB/DinJ family antitoxin [Lentisphaerae bacterium]|nr:type II toxin-antitoxin system RelB/DinJ family antitoxin [Lentisphaerota bacterium]